MTTAIGGGVVSRHVGGSLMGVSPGLLGSMAGRADGGGVTATDGRRVVWVVDGACAWDMAGAGACDMGDAGACAIADAGFWDMGDAGAFGRAEIGSPARTGSRRDVLRIVVVGVFGWGVLMMACASATARAPMAVGGSIAGAGCGMKVSRAIQ